MLVGMPNPLPALELESSEASSDSSAELSPDSFAGLVSPSSAIPYSASGSALVTATHARWTSTTRLAILIPVMMLTLSS